MDVILKIYYIILIYTVFGKHLFSFPDTISDVLVVGFIILSTYYDKYKLRIDRKTTSYLFWTSVLPALVILVFSISLQFVQSLSSDYFVRSTTLCLRWILYCLWGARTIYVFKEKSADVLLTASLIAYVPTVLIYFFQLGLVNGFKILFSENAYHASVTLEVHRLTYVFGFLAVYYLYKWLILKKRALPQLVLSGILLFMGLKRIADFAFVAAAIVIIVLKFIKKEKNKYRLACIISVSLVFVALAYIYLIKSGYLQLVFRQLGIRDNFRFNFWNHIAPEYEFSPKFLGNGISFAHRFMWHEWSNIEDLGAVTNLHNDILSYYVGLGFIGFILYFLILFTGQAVLLKKWFSTSSAVFAVVISLYYFIVMATSNEGLPGFVFASYLMLIFASTTETLVNPNKVGRLNE